MPKAQTISPLPAEAWPTALDHVKADMNGAPIHVHQLMAHSPELLRAWWDFRNFSVNGGTLGARLGELVILRVGVHLGAWYEWGSHVDRAMRIGLGIETIRDVLLRPIGPHWSELDGLVLHAVDDLMSRRAIQDSTRAALETHLTTAQIMDLIAIHGMYVTLGCMIHTWGLELDDPVAERIKGLTDRETFEAAAKRFAAEASQ